LIIDNADDPDLDLLKLFPAGGGGHILVTTRNPNNVVHATVGEEPFREMEPEDAVTLLLKAAQEPGRNDFLDPERRRLAMPIAAALGYLALALTHAGTTIRRNIYTLEEYLSEYTKHRLLPKDSKSPGLTKETITTTWEMPYKRIEDQKTAANLDAIDILHVFAFLHFKDIPELLFQKSWEKLQQQPSLSKSYLMSFFSVLTGSQARELPHMLRQDGATWDKPRFHRALAVLSELSLIYYDTEKEHCSMHPVVHAWARERLSINLQRRWRGIVTNMLSASINTMLEASGRPYRRTLLPHIECCLKDPVFELGGKADPNGACALKFASVYAECGLWKQAQKLQRDVVRLRTRLYGAAHVECLMAMRDLGRTCWNLFDLKEGLEVQTTVFETRTRLQGLTDPLGLKAMDDLARSYWLLGDRKKSRDLGAAAILGLKQRLGPADPATLTAMHNLACTLLHLGQVEKASELLIDVLEIRTRFWGLQHDDTLATMSELGMCYLKLGRLADAEYYTGKALENRTAILGEEHAYTLWSINDLSKVRCARGHAEEAANMLEDIIPVVERTLGNAHVGMSMTRYNLATAYAEQERWHETETILKQQLGVVSPRHPDWGISMKQLARVYEQQGRKGEAQKVLASISHRPRSSGDGKSL
jgi:tetratricopeptide (TPR) repeat protein